METAKVDLRKLQLLNDRISQVIEVLNQVRFSVHGLQHTPGWQPSWGWQQQPWQAWGGQPWGNQSWGSQSWNVQPWQWGGPQQQWSGPQQQWASQPWGGQPWGQWMGPTGPGVNGQSVGTPPPSSQPVSGPGLSHTAAEGSEPSVQQQPWWAARWSQPTPWNPVWAQQAPWGVNFPWSWTPGV